MAKPCNRCNGTGRQLAESRYDGCPGPSTLMETCMRCLGSGWVGAGPAIICPNCNMGRVKT